MMMMLAASAAFVGPNALSTVHRAHPPHASGLGATGELPRLYRERWANEATSPPQAVGSVVQREAAARLGGALLGASVFAMLGAAVSSAGTDESIRMLGRSGAFNDQVLFTDTLMRGLDAANMAGFAVLPLAALYLFQATPSAELYDIDAADEDTEACLVDVPICGRASFDSTDDMVCVEHFSDGKYRWVCA